MNKIAMLLISGFALGFTPNFTNVLAFGETALPTPSAIGEKRPNILVIMAEDMSSKVGAFGDAVAVTPNLDKLAAQGVRFSNVYTTAGVCAPSRASHITGMHQISLGGQHMRSGNFKGQKYLAVPPPEVKAYPELLRRAGYYTFTNRKLDYQFSSIMSGSGPFTVWDDDGPNPDWNLRASDQPFYGLINLLITHESQLFQKNIERNRSRGLEKIVSADQVVVPPYYPDTLIVREAIAQQYDNIHAMDKQVGDLIAKLQADNIADNTIVIWTTDHGDGLPRGKRELYDSGLKVPMIIHWPERLRPSAFKNGDIDRRLISFVDFAPSVLQVAGVPIPDYVHGTTTLFDKGVVRDYVYAAKDRMDEFPFRERAIRDHRFKYIYNYQPDKPGAVHLRYRDQLSIMEDLWSQYEKGSLNNEQAFWFQPRPEHEFYDLENDPHEVNNLADNPDYKLERLRLSGQLKQRMLTVGDLSDQSELELAQQFWPQGIQPKTTAPRLELIGKSTVKLIPVEPNSSIGYRFDGGQWLAYQPDSLIAVPNSAKLEVKAVRYGWSESDTVYKTF